MGTCSKYKVDVINTEVKMHFKKESKRLLLSVSIICLL